MSVVDDAVQAVVKTAVALAPDGWVPGGAPDPLIAHKHGHVGAPVSRLDGPLKVSGRAPFAAEVALDGMLYGALAYSTVAKGRIASIDTRAAQAAPGVAFVMTHLNAPRLKPPPKFLTAEKAASGDDLPIMQDDRAHWNGEPIAVVLAETQEQADHATSLVRAAYQADAAVTSLAQARARERTPKKVVDEPPEQRFGDAEAALAAAPSRVDAVYRTLRHNHNAIEPHAATLAWSGEELTIHDSTQLVSNVAWSMAQVFGLKEEQVRVSSPFVGGGFGGKTMWRHQVLAAAASRLAGRPVRMTLSREGVYRVVGGRAPVEAERHEPKRSADGPEGRWLMLFLSFARSSRRAALSASRARRLVVMVAATLSMGAAPSATRLRVVFSSDLITNGVTQSASGRMFLPVAHRRTGDPQLIEARNGKPAPFPDAAWNAPGPLAGHFNHVNAARVGPDGALWVVDSGSAFPGRPATPGAGRLIRIDLATNRVTRVFDLREALKPTSFVDDVRFNRTHAYLTDAGRPGLIVLDLGDGRARRVLDRDASTTARGPLVAEERVTRDEQGRAVRVNADQLEVSPDGRWLYFQPSDGGLSRLATHLLDDPATAPVTLSRAATRFADTPTTGGTAIAADGVIYLSDCERSRILTISPSGRIATLIVDPRLIWTDAMWITDHGELLMPASQLDRLAGLNGGVDVVRPPVQVFALDVGARPVRR